MRQTTPTHLDALPLLQRASLRDEGRCGWPAGAPVATLILDADDLGDVNERLGAETGDLVLAELADRLQERLCRTGVTTHLDREGPGIRCEGLSCGDPLPSVIAQALRAPFRVGREVVEVRVQVAALATGQLLDWAS
jgi:hypothetical protein